MKLDSKTVDALRLDGKTDAIFFDDTLTGFGFRLRAGANGKVLRSWIVQYRRAGATRRMLLGSAEVLTAEKARAAAKEVLAKVVLGQDPQADRADQRDSDQCTFRKAVAEFLETKQRHLRPHTFIETKRYLTAGYFKPLHGMPLNDITRQDVALRIRVIERESSNTVAGEARAKLSAFFTWCMQEGLLTGANPIVGTRKPVANRSRDRVLSDPELAAIWRACGDDDFGKVIKLLILLGARRQEVGGMCWAEFAPDKSTWTLPSERSKNGRPHTLPVLGAVRAIVDTVPQMASRDLLFGSYSPKGLGAWGEGKRALDERLAGQVQPWKVHDIRRTVATRMCDIGIGPHVVEQILNHRSGHRVGVAGVYNKSLYEREVRNALAMWEDHIRALIEGGERKVLNFQPQPATAT
jgi:integrase